MSPASNRRRGFARRDRKTTVLLLADDTEMTTSSDAIAAAGLPADTTVLDQEQAAAVREAESATARDRALRLLGYRERSASELKTRLLDDGYPQPVVESVLQHLLHIGLVDDSRFASSFVRSKAAAGWGRSKVLRSLREHEIDVSVTEEALDEWLAGEDEVARAVLVLRSARIETHKDRERALRRLVNKGFSFSQAKEAISQLEATQTSES